MKVSDLIEKLKKLPQDSEVVVAGTDRSYRRSLEISREKAEVTALNNLYQYYSEKYKSNPENEVIDVVVIK
jgi:hypothetical protein